MELEEARKHWKNNLDKWKKDRPDLSNTEIVEEIDYDYKAIELILNLIEKQQKELEQEKEKNKELEENYDKLTKHFIENHISKDKIKEKIEEIINSSARYNVLCKINENEETRRTRYAVAVLKELLEEV